MTDTTHQEKRIELKYLLDRNLSDQVKSWARKHLGVDQHCNDSLGDSYEVNTLYLDTAELDLFHRTRTIGRSKHRVRRYGDEPTLWLESKRKKGNVVRKNRTAAGEEEVLARLSNPILGTAWCGDWFSQRMIDRRLRPAVQVHYRRFARTRVMDGESLRLTIDTHLHASSSGGWQVSSASGEQASRQRMKTTDVEILELKFHNHMPHLFKELLRTFAIPATSFSKYRTAIETWNLHLPAPTLLPNHGSAVFKDSYSHA